MLVKSLEISNIFYFESNEGFHLDFFGLFMLIYVKVFYQYFIIKNLQKAYIFFVYSFETTDPLDCLKHLLWMSLYS